MTNKVVYYNDTGRDVSIHPATKTHGCEVDMAVIKPLEVRVFILPEDTYAWIKMWDYKEGGLQILVSPQKENKEDKFHKPIDTHNN